MCWNKGRLCWKIAKLFYFCHLKKLVRPETFGPYYVSNWAVSAECFAVECTRKTSIKLWMHTEVILTKYWVCIQQIVQVNLALFPSLLHRTFGHSAERVLIVLFPRIMVLLLHVHFWSGVLIFILQINKFLWRPYLWICNVVVTGLYPVSSIKFYGYLCSGCCTDDFHRRTDMTKVTEALFATVRRCQHFTKPYGNSPQVTSLKIDVYSFRLRVFFFWPYFSEKM